MVRPRDAMQVLGQLTDRDNLILEWLYDHKIMTTAQLARALSPSLDSAQERVRKLHVLGLLDRGRMYCEGAGKHSWRYMLDYEGWAIVSAYRGDALPPRRDKIRARNLNLVQSPKKVG
jgi:predicted transcriptional regulator